MIPFLESVGGNCQVELMLVGVAADTIKLTGACKGTENHQLNKQILEFQFIIQINFLF